jgi:hypothetical protein
MLQVQPAEHWAAHVLNGGGGVAPPSTSRPPTAKAPRPQGATPRPVSYHASSKPKIIRGRPEAVAFSRTPEAAAWYNEVGVESWERRAAARIGVVLPGGETPRPQTVDGRASVGFSGGLTTERLWAMNAGEGQPRASRGGTPRLPEPHGTPRSPGRQSEFTPRAAQPSERPHSALSDRHAAGEAQREAVRSAVSYFYRFAERHIDGETSAVSSAADVQVRVRGRIRSPQPTTCRR